MVFGNGVKNIQAAAYNGARMAPNPRFKVIALLITYLAMKISLFFSGIADPKGNSQ